MILVTGAAGKTGRAIIRRLAAGDQPVRALVRSQEQGKIVIDLGANEVVVGDLEDPQSLRHALAGVMSIYYICPNMHPRELSIGEKAIAAAKAAGVERFVYHSVLHPQVEAMPHHWQKMRVEERVFSSGLSFTILQPAAYMQNVLGNWERIVSTGYYEIPYSLDTPMSLVDLVDLAEVAVKVLVESGHEGAIYELCAHELYTQREIASLIGDQLGRVVKAEVISSFEWEQRARAGGLSHYAIRTLLQMFGYYDRYGFWGNGNILRWLLGRAPTTFETFLERVTSDEETVEYN